MVQSIIDIGENEDRVINIVKARFGLKNKSQAIALIAKTYEDSFLEPELKPSYIVKLGTIKREKGIKFNGIEELRQITGG